MRAPTWAVASQKGGVAKTTTAVSLGACLVEQGLRVLLIDLDPQCNATQWLRGTPGDALGDILTGTSGSIGTHIHPTDSGVHIVPGCPGLTGLDRYMAKRAASEVILRDALEDVTADAWDVVLLDCPPSLGLATVGALVASHKVLVPVEPAPMALAGVDELMSTVGEVRRLNKGLEVGGVLVCRAKPRTTLTKDVIGVLRDRFGPALFKTVIRDTVRLSEASGYQEPITTFDSRGNGATDYRAVAQEMLTRLGRRPRRGRRPADQGGTYA